MQEALHGFGDREALFPRDHYVVHPSAGLVCCAIPKNGCSTTKRWILQNIDPSSVENPALDIHKECRDRFSLAAYDSEEAQRIFDQSFRFTFVRDPASRLASAFVDKFVGPKVHEMTEGAIEVIEHVHRRRGVHVQHDTSLWCCGGTVEVPASSIVDYLKGITFREFVEYLRDTSDEHLDPHWRPQTAFTGRQPFHAVLRTSAISQTLRRLSEELGLAPPAVPTMNALEYTSDLAETRLADMPSGEMRRKWIRPTADMLFTDDLRAAIQDRYASGMALHETALPEFGDEQVSVLRSVLKRSPL